MTTIPRLRPGTQVRITGCRNPRFEGLTATVVQIGGRRGGSGIAVRFEPSTHIDFLTSVNYWFVDDEYEVLP